MHFDEHCRVHWTPREFFELARDGPRRLINQYLLRATPRAFPSIHSYSDFLEAVSERTGVAPQNLVLRGSCQIGFSISPDNKRVWRRFDDQSDLDLAIVDAEFFDNTERRVSQWERTSRVGEVEGRAAERFQGRQNDRYYHCCRIHDLPRHLCANYVDAMRSIAELKCAGVWREVKAFIYRDWWAIRARYEYDLKQLCDGVGSGVLIQPGDAALPRFRPPRPPAAGSSPPLGSPVSTPTASRRPGKRARPESPPAGEGPGG